MNRLRNRLIFVFILATLLPLCLTLWTSLDLLERSLNLAPLKELDAASKSLESTGRELFKDAQELLRRDVAEGRIEPQHLKPAQAQAFWDSGEDSQFERAGDREDRLDYYVRKGDEVLLYSRPL